jgi:hypothetical protein
MQTPLQGKGLQYTVTKELPKMIGRKKADIAHESRGNGCINWLDWGVISE